MDFVQFSVCSLCIRNNISLKNSCPICFVDISDGMLRPNRCLEEIIKCFQPVKNYVLKTVEDSSNQLIRGDLSTETSRDSLPSYSSQSTVNTQAQSEILPETNIHEENPSTSSFPAPDSQSLFNYIASFLEPPSMPPVNTPVPSCSQPVRASRPSAHQQPQRKSSYTIKEVPCPVCNTLMREAIINMHLDSCLKSDKPAKRKPMPKLIYHLMKDQELRKRLRELGLSSTGDKNTLINRLKKFTILFNSECDAVDPRPVEELREIFEREEAENRRLANELRYAPAKVKTNDIEKIDEENLRYLRKNKQSYDRLINEIRQRPPLPSPPTTLPLPEEPAAFIIKNEPPKVENDSEDEVTEIYVPPKIYEMICLSDSENDEPPSSRPVSASGDFSRPSSSNDSIPDPMESGCSKDSDSVSDGAQTITLSSSESSGRSSSSPTCYSPAGESSEELLFDQESSNSLSNYLPSSVQLKVSKKRAKSPSLNMSDRKLSLRRKL